MIAKNKNLVEVIFPTVYRTCTSADFFIFFDRVCISRKNQVLGHFQCLWSPLHPNLTSDWCQTSKFRRYSRGCPFSRKFRKIPKKNYRKLSLVCVRFSRNKFTCSGKKMKRTESVPRYLHVLVKEHCIYIFIQSNLAMILSV